MKLSRYKRTSPVSYAFGATIVYELIKTHPELITRVFLRPDIKHGEDLERILAELKQRNVEIIESTKAFNILGAKDNCLLAAEFKKPAPYHQVNYVEPHVVLVNPSDAGNVGTIMRSAVAFGFKNLVVVEPCVDPYDPKTIRASMGAIFHLNVEFSPSFDDYNSAYGCEDWYEDPTPDDIRQCYAFMLNPNAAPLSQITPPSNNYYSLVFGNEATGLPKDFCDNKYQNVIPVYIPQSPNVDSLNLSAAASIALHALQP